REAAAGERARRRGRKGRIGAMPVLFLHYPDKKKRWTREVLKDRFTIGRSRDAEVCIPHTSVSKQHVLVEKRNGRFIYRDLGSTNGIYLNEFRKDQGTLE